MNSTPMIVRAAVLLALGAACRVGRAESPVLENLGTIDLAPREARIVAYYRPDDLLLVTDAPHGDIHLLRAVSWNPPAFTNVDAFPPTDDTDAAVMPGEPTSVAVHPSLPLAIAVCADLSRVDRGQVVFLDLRDRSPGRVLRTQGVGFHPDGVAISADGRWALIANKAEGDGQTVGSIGLLDLRSLEGWDEDRLLPVPYRELGGLGQLLGQPDAACRPKSVAFDPAGRFAAVSCQPNDAVVLVDLQADEPALACALPLAQDAQPDGLSILDGADDALLAVAEEGATQAVSFYRVDPARLADPPVLLSSVDVRPLVNGLRPHKRRDPQSVLLCRSGGRTYALVATKLGRRVIGLDVTDPSAPTLVGKVAVGTKPEGLALIEQAGGDLVVTGNKGDGGGSLSVLRLRGGPQP